MAEVDAARAWLRHFGVHVETPSRLLSVRIGARRPANTPARMAWLAGSAVAGAALTLAFGLLQMLPTVQGGEMTESRYFYFILAAIQLGTWLSVRHRERQLGGLPVVDRRSGRPSVLKVMSGWYLASLLITFVGGAALAVAMYFTTSAQTYAWSWLVALGWAAMCCAVVLVGTLSRRVRAEDTLSAAVDTVLRSNDLLYAMPGVYTVFILIDPLFSHRSPEEFTWWLVLYAVLAAVTTAAAFRQQWRRAVPQRLPDTYGTEINAALRGDSGKEPGVQPGPRA
ncbi:hypothetical protein [Amycolatopsis sp. lyj-112]|uniref:hypothetical protein n=1 Tax=Amycolatopsis sp. lyj-112 TaxID=2789288 RepID=UPI00397DFCEF